MKIQSNKGQDIDIWTDSWRKFTPESEIRKWDYYGLRRWILKYVPRHGKVIEAGCGLGRWVFYLSKLGVKIEGLDFSKQTIYYLNQWKKQYNFSVNFVQGDVSKLPYEENSLSGYISLGVMEHFIEGPIVPIREALRVLRPGGIAIITTPSISWLLALRRLETKIKKEVKRLLKKKIATSDFFQYEYRPNTLKRFCSNAGLKVTVNSGADLLYTFCELGGFTGKNINKGSFAFWFTNKFENTFLSNFGAQSIVIALKIDDPMYCFLCGEKNADISCLNNYDVPICDS